MKYQQQKKMIDYQSTCTKIMTNPQQLVTQQELEFQHSMMNVVHQILEKQCHIILLTGPSASGKTTTAKIIQQHLRNHEKKIYRISLDNFYRSQHELPRWSDGFINYESIDGLDIHYFNQLIYKLKTTGEAEFPIFDFYRASRSEKKFRVFMEQDTYIIFEGIHALNPKLHEQLNDLQLIKIYVNVHSDFVNGKTQQLMLSAQELRLMRRMLRDNTYRNTNIINTLEMWNYVLKGEVEYIHPFCKYADVHINSTHAYEPYLYRVDVERECSHYETHHVHSFIIRCLREKIQQFPPIVSKYVPASSLIREFI